MIRDRIACRLINWRTIQSDVIAVSPRVGSSSISSSFCWFVRVRTHVRVASSRGRGSKRDDSSRWRFIVRGIIRGREPSAADHSTSHFSRERTKGWKFGGLARAFAHNYIWLDYLRTILGRTSWQEFLGVRQKTES